MLEIFPILINKYLSTYGRIMLKLGTEKYVDFHAMYWLYNFNQNPSFLTKFNITLK